MTVLRNSLALGSSFIIYHLTLRVLKLLCQSVRHRLSHALPIALNGYLSVLEYLVGWGVMRCLLIWLKISLRLLVWKIVRVLVPRHSSLRLRMVGTSLQVLNRCNRRRLVIRCCDVHRGEIFVTVGRL